MLLVYGIGCLEQTPTISGVATGGLEQTAPRSVAMASKQWGGRPPVYTDREMIWGSIDGADNAEIVALAENLGLSRSRVVAALIKHGLQHLDDVEFPPGKKPGKKQEELPLGRVS